MKFSHFSIGTTLIVIISALNILIAVLVGAGVYRSWNNLQQTRNLKEESSIVNLLYNTEKFLSIERGLSIALADPLQQIAGVSHADIAENRRNADQRLEKALEKISSRQDPELAAVLLRVNDSYQKIRALREKFDQNATGKVLNNDVIFSTITKAIVDIESLIKILSRPLLSVNATVSQQIFFKHFIWEITEYAGREYAMIGRLIIDNRLPDQAMQENLIAWKDRTEHDWELSLHFAEGGALAEKMAAHIEEARTHYFLTFDQIKDMFYRSGQEEISLPYPISIALWLDMSSQVVDSLMTLKDMSLQETQAYIEDLEDEALRSIVLNLLLFTFALSLSFYCWWVILHRVVRPVSIMSDSLYRQAHAAAFSAAATMPDKDEIGKLAHALQIFQQSTRRIEQTSKDLEQQKNNLEAIFQTALDAIVTIDEEGSIIEWNRQAEEIFGWKRSEALGKNMMEMILPPAYRQVYITGIQNFLAAGSSDILNRRTEFEAQNRHGVIFPVEIAVTVLKAGDRFNFTAFISDISVRKKAEEERARYLKNLEDSNRELDDFAYIASHDLKEPLRGMHNFSRFLLEDYEEKLGDEGKNMLHTIAGLTKRMDELLSALLHYSRLGRIELSVRETDLNKIVQDCIDLYAIKIRETGTEVILLRELPAVVCDHVRIAEVFQNLIGNALKYSENKNSKIEIGYTLNHPDFPNEIVYFVRDSGIGIEKKNLESIFKIFRRLHTQDAYGGGTGSGLTIAKKIINRHGGKIWAESPGKGQGTTFFFTIPSQVPAATQHAA